MISMLKSITENVDNVHSQQGFGQRKETTELLSTVKQMGEKRKI